MDKKKKLIQLTEGMLLCCVIVVMTLLCIGIIKKEVKNTKGKLTETTGCYLLFFGILLSWEQQWLLQQQTRAHVLRTASGPYGFSDICLKFPESTRSHKITDWSYLRLYIFQNPVCFLQNEPSVLTSA